MPSKKKEYFFHLDFDCDLTVVKDLQKTFLSDIQRREYSLYVSIKLNDDVTMDMGLYPDHFTSGALSLIHVGGDKFSLECRGVAPRVIDPKFDKDLLDALSKSDLVVVPVSLSNSDGESADLEPSGSSIYGRCSLR